MNIGVILAGGLGLRTNLSIPKPFVKLHGKHCISYVLKEFKLVFDKIIVVVPNHQYDYLFEGCDVVIGGKTRNESVNNAIERAKLYNPTKILFHDAARPLIKSEDLKLILNKLDNDYAVVVGEKITDSLQHYAPVEDRNKFTLIQTPEAFNFECLYKEFNKDKEDTAIYSQLSNSPAIVYLDHPNNKLTYFRDILVIENLLKYNKLELNTPNLKNKNVLVFGATGGVGSCLVEELKLLGCKINTPKRTSVNLGLNCNLSNWLDLNMLDFNPDVIINASGVCYDDNAMAYEEMSEVNAHANLTLIEWAHSLNKPVNLVFISSSSANRGRSGFAGYSASKAALHSIVEACSQDYPNLRINCIAPEKINTKMLQKTQTKLTNLSEVLDPKEVAQVILSYCDTDKTGQIIYLRKGML